MSEASAPTAISVEDLHMSYGPNEAVGGISLGATNGTGLSANNVAVLAAWAIGSAIVATRAFKWEPQTARA